MQELHFRVLLAQAGSKISC